jgi:hypothetical protein
MGPPGTYASVPSEDIVNCPAPESKVLNPMLAACITPDTIPTDAPVTSTRLTSNGAAISVPWRMYTRYPGAT